MSEAGVRFYLDTLTADTPGEAPVGKEVEFSFQCPKQRFRCGNLLIRGRTTVKHDPANMNGGTAQWSWDGNREAPTFSPSINCKGCWHGYIRAGRCVDTAGKDEP